MFSLLPRLDEYVGISDPGSISPLPEAVHRVLPVVAAMGTISFITTVALFLRLTWLFIRWRKDGYVGANQILILIYNLILADIQQAAAFMINAHWLRLDAILADTSVCWAQGWFVSTGDLASGVFTFAIAVHAFADIIWNYRLKTRTFILAIIGCWTFVFLLTIIGIAMHPGDFYTRAGPWCFINNAYNLERLYLHYLWIIVVEFGTVAIYAVIFLILRRRVRESFYTESKTAQRAKSAAKMMVAYPIVYCVCTLPVVTARLSLMAGGKVGYVYLCIGGAMITSNGWLDVILYTLTRSSYLIHGEPPAPAATVLETFRMPGQTFNDRDTLDSQRALWTRRGDFSDSRPGTADGPWGRVDVKNESIRIQERASLSLRQLEHESGRHTQEQEQGQTGHGTPRFFQRIYQPGNGSTSPNPLAPRSHSPLNPLSQPQVQQQNQQYQHYVYEKD